MNCWDPDYIYDREDNRFDKDWLEDGRGAKSLLDDIGVCCHCLGRIQKGQTVRRDKNGCMYHENCKKGELWGF